MIASAALSKRALSMFGRVFPRTSMIAQAIAFNLFLAFFPTLLIAVGLATSPIGGHASDAAFDGRNPHNLWRSRPAGIFYQAIARAIAADIDDRSLAGGGDSRRVRTALAAMAGFGVRKRCHGANVVGGLFSWRH